jgi:hypothetical protein
VQILSGRLLPQAVAEFLREKLQLTFVDISL